MYVRFEGPGGLGLFQLASKHEGLFRQRGVARREAAEADRLRQWLWQHTPAPPKWVYDPPAPDLYPSTWFRRGFYVGYIPRAFRLAELLAGRGVRIRVLEVETLPGRVVYREKVQAVLWARGGLPRGERVVKPRCASRRRATLRGHGTLWQGGSEAELTRAVRFFLNGPGVSRFFLEGPRSLQDPGPSGR